MKFSISKFKFFKSKVYLAFLLLFSVFIIGILGFRNISDFSWFEAIYMTVITVTTVGFGEVQPLDDASRMFTVFLILISVAVYLYAVSIFTEYIANGEIFKRLNQKSVEKKIKALNNHTIIVGYGRNGKQAAQKLEHSSRQYLIIEQSQELVNHIIEEGMLCLQGDATEDAVLEMAAIERAHSIILALPSDADNLFVSISAKQQNPNVLIISRASSESSLRKLKIVGVDNVIMPDKIGGDHMASLVVSPDLIEFIDKLSLDGDCDTNLRELSIEGTLKKFENKSIKDLDIRKKTGCSVIGLKTTNGEYTVNPDPNMELDLGVRIIVLGNPSQIEKLEKYF